MYEFCINCARIAVELLVFCFRTIAGWHWILKWNGETRIESAARLLCTGTVESQHWCCIDDAKAQKDAWCMETGNRYTSSGGAERHHMGSSIYNIIYTSKRIKPVQGGNEGPHI